MAHWPYWADIVEPEAIQATEKIIHFCKVSIWESGGNAVAHTDNTRNVPKVSKQKSNQL
jgi:hypothetical protein